MSHNDYVLAMVDRDRSGHTVAKFYYVGPSFLTGTLERALRFDHRELVKAEQYDDAAATARSFNLSRPYWMALEGTR